MRVGGAAARLTRCLRARSAFIAIGYSHYDVQRGMTELETLFRGQWTDGRVPHIVFNTSVGTYFPDYHFWQTNRSSAAPAYPPTSGIVQPPVHPLAVERLFERAANRTAAIEFLRRMYPKLTAWVDYLYRERDPDGDGLAYIVHPWYARGRSGAHPRVHLGAPPRVHSDAPPRVHSRAVVIAGRAGWTTRRRGTGRSATSTSRTRKCRRTTARTRTGRA